MVQLDLSTPRSGAPLFKCANCIISSSTAETVLTNREELISTRFTGSTGRAYLFSKAFNLRYGESKQSQLDNGHTFIGRDVSCEKCDSVVGWVVDSVEEETQKYLEGRVILERALIIENSLPAVPSQ